MTPSLKNPVFELEKLRIVNEQATTGPKQKSFINTHHFFSFASKMLRHFQKINIKHSTQLPTKQQATQMGQSKKRPRFLAT